MLSRAKKHNNEKGYFRLTFFKNVPAKYNEPQIRMRAGFPALKAKKRFKAVL